MTRLEVLLRRLRRRTLVLLVLLALFLGVPLAFKFLPDGLVVLAFVLFVAVRYARFQARPDKRPRARR